MRKIECTLSEHFWSRVMVGEPEECWEWGGRKNFKGYGGYTWRRKSYQAHRIAYILANGEVPEGLCVLHRCDNPGCCNPRHLWIGTNSDNTKDKMAKGRHHNTSGSKNGNATITEEDVVEIRSMARNGLKYRDIGKQYNLTADHVWKIISYRSWNSVP